MQRAMVAVNRQLTAEGLPALELKIGVHTGEVVVGNIGSHRRAKYGIVGSPVNLVSRIQAYCSGGQILCSEDTLREIGDSVEFDECVEVRAKGFREVIRTFSVRGFDAQPELSIPRRIDEWTTLAQEFPVRFRVVVQNRLGEGEFMGNLSKLSQGEAEIHGIVQEGCPLQPTADAKACPLLRIPRLTDLALVLNPHELIGSNEPIYAQVTQLLGNEGVLVRFTSVSPMQRRLLDRLFASASQDKLTRERGARQCALLYRDAPPTPAPSGPRSDRSGRH
jgi:adenylate cyclase